MIERPLPPVRENRYGGMNASGAPRIPLGMFREIENMRLEDGVLRTRHGFGRFGPAGPEAPVRGLFHSEARDGTITLVKVVDADLQFWSWTNLEWTVTDTAGIAGVTIDPAAEVRFTNSRGRIVATDGVNTPWMLAGGVYTRLDGAPISDIVAVYYDKVFFVGKGADASTLFWSEEGDPTTGYDEGEFSNAWDFAQTDQGAITGLAALNNRLLVFKQDSVAEIWGAVEEDFRTAANRESISQSEGCIAPDSIVIVDDKVFFCSQRGPRVIVGQQIVDPTRDQNGDDRIREIWARVDRAHWHDIRAVHIGREVWWVIPQTTGADFHLIIVYSLEYDAWWTYSVAEPVYALARIEDPEGEEWVLTGSDDGSVYRYRAGADGAVVFDDAGVAYPKTLVSRRYGRSTPEIQKRFVEAQWEVGCDRALAEGFSSGYKVGAAVDGLRSHALRQADRYIVRRGYSLLQEGPSWAFSMSASGDFSLFSSVVIFTPAARPAT